MLIRGGGRCNRRGRIGTSTEGTNQDVYRDEYGEDFGDDCEDDAYLKTPLTTCRPPSQYAALRTQDNSLGGRATSPLSPSSSLPSLAVFMTDITVVNPYGTYVFLCRVLQKNL